MKSTFLFFIPLLIVLGAISCKKKHDDTATGPSLDNQFLNTYADIAYSSYNESKMYANALKTAVDNFTANPNAEGLIACKDAYKMARLAYLQTEVFRGVDGPIDNEDGAPESWINSWPLNEGNIDFMFDPTKNSNQDTNKVNGKLDGIINDPTQTITKEGLLGIYLDKNSPDDDIPTGYHAIEFLLWGQDIYAGGPGQRPYTDYLIGEGATAPNGDRRKTYLSICADLLVENLQTVLSDWDPAVSGNYRADLLNSDASNVNSRLKTIVSGMTKMSKNEFGTQRILNGLSTGNQEEEHSCFSDLTPMDFRYDVVGYDNVIEGRHTLQTGVLSVSGVGLKQLIAKYSGDDAQKVQLGLDSMNTTSIQSYNLVTPYDQIILNPNTPEWTIEYQMAYSWVQLSDALNLASQAMGFGVVDTTPTE